MELARNLDGSQLRALSETESMRERGFEASLGRLVADPTTRWQLKHMVELSLKSEPELALEDAHTLAALMQVRAEQGGR